jgi:ankyrin repeat protein
VRTIIEVLDFIIHGENIAEVNAKGNDDYTALHLASNQGNVEAIAAILTYGCKVMVEAKNFAG